MQENQQPPEKQVKLSGPVETATLSVHSIFYTIQGEGPFTGRPAVFVRLAGCNLQCNFCDTDYTVGRQLMTVAEIVREVYEVVSNKSHVPELVVITGGEPFRQPIGDLIRELNASRRHVQIETNGTLFVHDMPWTISTREAIQRGQKVDAFDFAHSQPQRNGRLTVVCSPKTGKVVSALHPYIDAYKYVVEAGCIADDDGLPILALGHAARPRVARPHDGFAGTVYVQPIDVQDDAQNAVHTSAAIASCMKHGYTLCLQTHKIVNLP